MGKYSQFVKDDNIRAEMARKKLTYDDMAEAMGKKSPASFMDIINGKAEPTISKMLAISKKLGCNVEYFFNIEVLDTRTA